MADVLRRAFGWWTASAGVLTALLFLIIALRLPEPAFDVAHWCASIAALAVAARVLAWVAVSGSAFGREERLLAFVMLAAVALGWIGTGEWLSDRAFDYRAAAQRADLMQTLHDTSVRLGRFCDARAGLAPPPPRPETWQQDIDARDRFDTETVLAYERRFGARVRAVHDLASLRGLRDRDLDAFVRHPANEFQMRVIAKTLDKFSATLARRP